MIERPTRVVGRRVIAYIIDLVILGAIDAALWLALTSSKPKATSTGGLVIGNTRHGFTSSGNRTLWFVLIAVTALLLFVVLPGLRGWSPGKLLVGIRLVNAEGVPPGILRSLLREVLWIVDGFPGYGLPLVGFITALATKANQRVGDLVARTYVVRAGAAGRPIGQLVPEIAGFPPGTRPTAAAPSPPAATTAGGAAPGTAAPGTAEPAPADPPPAEGAPPPRQDPPA